MLQYEQYEQEVKNLQRLIEEAHRIIQDRPVSTNNIQELQAQIHHHEVSKYQRVKCEIKNVCFYFASRVPKLNNIYLFSDEIQIFDFQSLNPH